MTANKKMVEEILTLVSLLEEQYEAEQSDEAMLKKELAQLIEKELNKALNMPEPLILVSARRNINILRRELLKDNSKESVVKALLVDLIDEEVRESLHTTILPVLTMQSIPNLQTIRLNTTKKIREDYQKGKFIKRDYSSVASFIERLNEDAVMKQLSDNENVIAEITFEILGL